MMMKTSVLTSVLCFWLPAVLAQPLMPDVKPDREAPPAVVLSEVEALSESELRLQWQTSSATDVTAYRVYRSRVKGTPQIIKTLTLADAQKAGMSVLVKETANTEIEYFYQLAAVDAAGNVSALSNRLALRLPDSRAPHLPLQLRVANSDLGVMLQWLPNRNDDLTGYQVYRLVVGSEHSFKKISPALLKTTEFVDEDAEGGQAYRYRVAAVDVYGNESAETRGVLFKAAYGEVAVPMNLALSTTKSALPRLTWLLPDGHQTGVIVMRDQGQGFEVVSGVVHEMHFVDRSAEPQWHYRYQVVAVSDVGKRSQPSKWVLRPGRTK